jgi:hypothetical protein
MLALCLRQSIRVVEAIVEVNVYVRRLVSQYGSERRAVGREALVSQGIQQRISSQPFVHSFRYSPSPDAL